MSENKWNQFLKSGLVVDYLAYVAERDKAREVEATIENSNSGINNQGNQRG